MSVVVSSKSSRATFTEHRCSAIRVGLFILRPGRTVERQTSEEKDAAGENALTGTGWRSLSSRRCESRTTRDAEPTMTGLRYPLERR